MLDSWVYALEGEAKAAATIRAYSDSVKKYISWAAANDLPTDTEGVTATDIRGYLTAETERTSAATASTDFRHLRVFWNWVGREHERVAPSPMTNVRPPHVTRKPKEYLDDDEIRALLEVCKGLELEDRRDTAIIRIFIDNGVRVSGMAGIRYHRTDPAKSDVDLKAKRLRITLKGGDVIPVPIGAKACAAIDRYIRTRNKVEDERAAAAAARGVSYEESPYLWIGTRGRNVKTFTDSGIRQMLERRGEQAGVPHVHPHRFRATFADDYLEAGGTLDELMAIAGWKSMAMPLLYAGERAAERARQAHERLSPGDRI
jgi:site-specific recombinase XerD